MKIAIYDEGDDQDPYSYGNGGLLVYHNAGTWKMYTDDVTRVQIADYLGIPTKDIDFSEQGMQDEEYMHFDIEDDTVSELIGKGAFKLEETATANVKESNDLEDRAEKMVLAKLMKEYKGYESMVANARGRDDKRMYKDRLRDLGQMIKYVQGKTPYGIDTILEEEVAEMIEKAMAKLKGKDVKEGGKRTYIPDADIPIPRLLRTEWQPDVTRALRKAAGLPDSAYVYFDDADLVYGEKTVWPMCGVDEKCTFGDAVKALKKFAKANPFDGERHFKEDDVDAVYPGTGDIYGYTWNCKKCGTENEFSMSRQDAQEYIDDWEADNQDLVADGETGSAALIDTLAQGEDSGFHYGNKCVKCGTEAKDPYSESINDIIRLSGLK